MRETTALTLTFLIHIADLPEVDRNMGEDDYIYIYFDRILLTLFVKGVKRLNRNFKNHVTLIPFISYLPGLGLS